MARQDKYFIFADEETAVALKYDMSNFRVMLGAPTRFQNIIEHIITEVWGLGMRKGKYTADGKVKYEFYMSRRKFLWGKEELERVGYTIVETTNHGRLMR